MATLHVRNFPDDLYGKLRDIASEEHRSLGAQVIVLIDGAVKSDTVAERRKSVLGNISRRRAAVRTTKDSANSLALLREDRGR